MLIKRNIRLKEFIPNATKVHFPSEKYLENSPQLLKNEAFYQSVNDNGMMEFPLDMKVDKTVVFLGDSFVENIFVNESGRMLNLLQKNFLKKNLNVKFYNAAVSGSTGLGLLNLFLNKIIPMKPDVVVYVQPSCDFSALIFEKGYYNDNNFFSNIVPAKNIESYHYETIYENLNQLQNVVTTISNSCQIFGIKLYMATCCFISSKRQLKMLNDIIRYNSTLGYEVIDLDVLVPRLKDYFYDKQHVNSRGSEFLSSIFYNHLYGFFKQEDFKVGKTTDLFFEKELINNFIVNNKYYESNFIIDSNLSDFTIFFEFECFDVRNYDFPNNIEINIEVEVIKNEKIIDSFVADILHPSGCKLEQPLKIKINEYVSEIKVKINFGCESGILIKSMYMVGVKK